MAVVIKKRSNFKGLHLPERKYTAGVKIERLPLPQRVLIPAQQSLGAPLSFTVKRKEDVLTGQKIADTDKYVSAPLHSSVSGTVIKVLEYVDQISSRMMDAVSIDSDGEDNFVETEKLFDLKEDSDPKTIMDIIKGISDQTIVRKIRDAGVVGLGGATFPTHVKLNPPPSKNIDTVILNGCECEPYITADHAVMMENGLRVLLGFYIISQVISPDYCYIAIEDNKKDAIEHMKELIIRTGLEDKFKVVSLPSRYPMGAEKNLIKNITDRTVPMGGLPMDVGVVVNNINTAKAVYEAVIEDRPLIEKVVTVTGNISKPKNLLVRIGTPVSELISACGGFTDGSEEIIAGGPMMGNAMISLTTPVTKGMNCVLVKSNSKIQEQNCIKCGRCVDICPMNLMPLMYVKLAKSGMNEKCQDYYISNCIECGSCAYVCPSCIPIVGYIKTAKATINKK